MLTTQEIEDYITALESDVGRTILIDILWKLKEKLEDVEAKSDTANTQMVSIDGRLVTINSELVSIKDILNGTLNVTIV